MAVSWDEDNPQDLPQIEANLSLLLNELIVQAAERHAVSVSMAQDWHRRIFEGIKLPVAYLAGEVRDSDSRFPELFGYEVVVGGYKGVPSALVPAHLDRLVRSLQAAIETFDRLLPIGSQPSSSTALRSVLELAAHAHGEWVRIHPFANGNGRTARLWANWLLLRYGLPPVVALRPRPVGVGYEQASMQSMAGDHRALAGVFATMLDQHLSGSG